MIIGIVGSEEAKFTELGRERAKALINQLVIDPSVSYVSSGHCHLGGIDIWAEQIAYLHDKFRQDLIFPPSGLNWEFYKVRNLKIADVSNEVHCITVDVYPDSYNGMKFKECYHCHTDKHIKSGGCWTMKQAIQRGKHGILHVIENYDYDSRT